MSNYISYEQSGVSIDSGEQIDKLWKELGL